MDPDGVRVQPAKELQRLSCPRLRDVDVEQELAEGRAHTTVPDSPIGVGVGAGGQEVGEPCDGDGDLLPGVPVLAAQHGARLLVQGTLDDGEGLGRAGLGRRRHLGDLEVVLLERAEQDGVHGGGGGGRCGRCSWRGG